MRLGSSLKRSRRRKPGAGRRRRGVGGRSLRGRRRAGGGFPARALAWGAGLALAGWVLGYGVATRLLFPAAPPPRDLVTLPDLRALPLADAAEALAGVGLSLGMVEEMNYPAADSGTVVGQSPLPGQLALPGDSVRVTVGLGPERRAVPPVARLRPDRAAALLAATGFAVTVDSVESAEPRGRILSVTPAEGEMVPLPGTVAMRVSLGPPAVEMPDLLGLAEAVARDSLNVLGLAVSEVEEVFRFGRDQGRVVTQDPPAGARVERGTAVRLVVGRRGGDR
ncbi:MAG: PASTA domain-containing protein [Longimicrobiales bacterium]|nr:PASTA domain-containing protein [Longimicrobiales bacterium]